MKLIIDIPDDRLRRFCKDHQDPIYKLVGNGIPYKEIPQGKWITHQTGYLLWEECNQCHAQVGTVGMNFCPNCGSDMRGKEE